MTLKEKLTMIGLTDIEKTNFCFGKMECIFFVFLLSFSALLIFSLISF